MVKFIVAKGVGFDPGSVKFIPTHGFLSFTALGRRRPKVAGNLAHGRTGLVGRG